MADQNKTGNLITELRAIHTGLHAAMDALMRNFDPNEAGEILIAVDQRLTTIINRVVAEDTKLREVAAVKKPEGLSVLRESVKLLIETWKKSGAEAILKETSDLTKSRLEMMPMHDGLDVVVAGLKRPLGTIRIETKGVKTIHYTPPILTRAAHDPTARDLEAWARAISDVWQMALRNVDKKSAAETIDTSDHSVRRYSKPEPGNS